MPPRRFIVSSSALRVWACGVLAGAIACGGKSGAPPVGSIDSAMVHVERQVSYGPRVPGSTARDNAARYLAHTLERYGARVSLQSFDVDDPYSDRSLRLINIVGSFAPEMGRRLMLCAHYDSRPWADQEADSALHATPILGAVDGAASVGVLLEIARLAGQRAPEGIGLDIVLFDGEDYGRQGDLDFYLLGSQYFATHLDGYRPVAAILLDMVGGVGTTVRRETLSKVNAGPLNDYVFERARVLELDYFQDAEGAPMIDDHVPLLRAGIPAIDLFGYDFEAWHTLGDDLSQVDPAKLAQVIALLRDIVYDFRYPPE